MSPNGSTKGIQQCLSHGYREHIVGSSSNGWDIIDVVCPDCGVRLLPREVVANPDGDRRSQKQLIADGSEQPTNDGYQPMTTEYGIKVTLERDSKYNRGNRNQQYWTAEPTSEDEAIDVAKRNYDGEITEIRGVDSREVPAPEGWSA